MKRTTAWCMYDWANSAFVTIVIAAVLPVYFESVVCGGEDVSWKLPGLSLHSSPASLWGYAMAAAAFVVAVLSPLFGAAADAGGRRKQFLGVLTAAGVASSLLLFFQGPGDVWSTLLFLLVGQVGFAGANVFYNSLLVVVAGPTERDAVSSRGYAFGYLGGGILLALNLLLIGKPGLLGLADPAAATRLSFVSVGVWWALFSVPLFRLVPGRLHAEESLERSFLGSLRTGMRNLRRTLGHVGGYSNLLRFLVAFLLYNDGVQTVILMAAIFASSELHMGAGTLVGALLLTQAVGVPGSILYGKAAARFGAKKAIMAGILVYLGIVVYAFRMSSGTEFWVLAGLVGLVQGGIQAVSRSFYSTLVPPSMSAEFFGFFAVSARFASIFGPLMFALIGDLTGSIRLSILSLSVLFVAGFVLMAGVRPGGEHGREVRG